MNPLIEDLLDQDAKARAMEGRLWDLETSALEEEAADVIRRLRAEVERLSAPCKCGHPGWACE